MKLINNKKRSTNSILLSSFLLFNSCSSIPSTELTLKEYGFLYGLWHGFSSLVSLIGSFFGEFSVYAINTTGFTYWLGFVIGFLLFLYLIFLIFVLVFDG